MILECSSKGDKRFSALYAKVKVFGVYDSIENHYQNCKRDINNQVVGKGKKVYKKYTLKELKFLLGTINLDAVQVYFD